MISPRNASRKFFTKSFTNFRKDSFKFFSRILLWTSRWVSKNLHQKLLKLNIFRDFLQWFLEQNFKNLETYYTRNFPRISLRISLGILPKIYFRKFKQEPSKANFFFLKFFSRDILWNFFINSIKDSSEGRLKTSSYLQK